MPRAPATALLLVPTDRHVEEALAAGRTARTVRGFVADALGAAWNLRLATAQTSNLAARLALDALPARADDVAEDPGARVHLARAIDQGIGRLRRAGATPSQLRAAGNTGTRRLLADVWEGTEARLAAAARIDARSAGAALGVALAADGTEPIEASLGLGLEHGVRVTGVAAWDTDNLVWLEALHGALRSSGRPGVTVELPRVGDDEGDPVAPLADALERRWASLADAPELDWPSARPTFDRILEAKTADGEARAVVAAVLDALARGTAAERIAIVVPRLDEDRLGPLRAALEDAGLPFVEPRGRPPSSVPEGRAALGLLALAAGPVQRDQIIELLRAPGLHSGTWVEQASAAAAGRRSAILAHRLREIPVRVDRTGRLFVDALAGAARGDDAWMARALERMLSSARWLDAVPARGIILQRFATLLDKLELGNPPASELARAIRDDGRESAALLRAIGAGAAAVRRLRDGARAIADAAELLGCADAPAGALEIALEIEDAAERIRSTSVRAVAVRIVRPADLCALELDLAVVTGLEARAYGDDAGRSPADPVAEGLPAPFRPVSAHERRARARTELAWAVAGAQTTVVSWCREREGEETLPHALVRLAASAGAATRAEPASRVAPGASVVDARGAELAALARGRPPPPAVAARAWVERTRSAFFADPSAVADPFSGAVVGGDTRLKDHLVACVGGHSPETPIAVTHVERTAECAFAGFARRVLKVRRIDDVDEAGDPRERGTLVHRALRAAFEAARGVEGNPDRALQLARAAAEAALEANASMTPLRREAVRRAVTDAVHVVARSIAAGDPLRFVAGERRFGPGEAAPWGVLELAAAGEPTIYVDGQIDRIDRTTDGRSARVIDYKTGTPPEAGDIGTLSLQLPLYAAVVARAFSASDVVASFVRITSRGVIEEWPAAAAKQRRVADLRDEASEHVRRVVLAVWNGDVAPRPAKPALCARCDARDVCRRPAVVAAEEVRT